MTTSEALAALPGIRAFGDSQPHADYGGWAGFIRQCCEVRDQHDGVVFFGVVNCNYIVFPCGTLVENYGYHGKALMSRVREKGAKAVLDEINVYRKAIQGLMSELRRRDVERESNKPASPPGIRPV